MADQYVSFLVRNPGYLLPVNVNQSAPPASSLNASTHAGHHRSEKYPLSERHAELCDVGIGVKQPLPYVRLESISGRILTKQKPGPEKS